MCSFVYSEHCESDSVIMGKIIGLTQWLCIFIYWLIWINMEHAVAQLVDSLRYKPEDREFDSRRCH